MKAGIPLLPRNARAETPAVDISNGVSVLPGFDEISLAIQERGLPKLEELLRNGRKNKSTDEPYAAGIVAAVTQLANGTNQEKDATEFIPELSRLIRYDEVKRCVLNLLESPQKPIVEAAVKKLTWCKNGEFYPDEIVAALKKIALESGTTYSAETITLAQHLLLQRPEQAIVSAAVDTLERSRDRQNNSKFTFSYQLFKAALELPASLRAPVAERLDNLVRKELDTHRGMFGSSVMQECTARYLCTYPNEENRKALRQAFRVRDYSSSVWPSRNISAIEAAIDQGSVAGLVVLYQSRPALDWWKKTDGFNPRPFYNISRMRALARFEKDLATNTEMSEEQRDLRRLTAYAKHAGTRKFAHAAWATLARTNDDMAIKSLCDYFVATRSYFDGKPGKSNFLYDCLGQSDHPLAEQTLRQALADKSAPPDMMDQFQIETALKSIGGRASNRAISSQLV